MKNPKETMVTLHTHSGRFQLERLPKVKKDTLRAWDAADELLLQTIFDEYSHLLTTPPLIANDAFGALAVALNDYPVHSWSDSFISHLATEHNFSLNKFLLSSVLIQSTEALKNSYDLVLIKIPKTLSLLEDQLYRLKPHIHSKTVVIGAAMSKHIHTSTLTLFEKIIGTTQTSRATKKARLIYAINDKQLLVDSDSPYPKLVKDDATGIRLYNYANVFANDHLDIGTRFFLQAIKQQLNHETENFNQTLNIIDLGCGNGVLGITAKQQTPNAHITFVDESYAAIASAKLNYSNEITNENAVDSRVDKTKNNAVFVVSNCLEQYQGNTPDLIFCNPPFHQAHAVSDHIAWSMFKQSLQKLGNNGQLWVVGNRHLGYHIKLKKLFGNVKTIASNKKFVILVAKK